jgi:hypothetical protein
MTSKDIVQRFALTAFLCVANMAPYAISLSLILVIHDKMIIGTNLIVLACICRHFEVPKIQENHMPK